MQIASLEYSELARRRDMWLLHSDEEEDREDCVKRLYERIESKRGLREGAEGKSDGNKASRTTYRKVGDYAIKKFFSQKEQNIIKN